MTDFLGLPPKMLDVIPDYRPVTPDTPAKARERARKRELYQAEPEKFRARKRVDRLPQHVRRHIRLMNRRKYLKNRKRLLADQARRGREREAALRILRAVLAILDGKPVRMRNRGSKYL